MLQEPVFRFLSVRGTNPRKKFERAPKTVPVYDDSAPTALGVTLKQMHAAGAPLADVLRVVRGHQESAAYAKSLAGLPFDVNKGLQWLAEHSAKFVRDVDFARGLQSLYGHTAAELVATEAFRVTRDRISDTLVAEAFRSTWERPVDSLASARKWIWLVEQSAAARSLDPDVRLGIAFADLLLWIANFGQPQRTPKRERPPPPESNPNPDVEKQDRLRKRLAELEDTHRELSRKTVDDDALLKPELSGTTTSDFAAYERRLAALEVKCQESCSKGEAPPPDTTRRTTAGATSPLASIVTKVRFKPDAIASLSDVSRRVATEARIDLARVEPTLAVEMLEAEMAATSAQLASSQSHNTVLMLGGVMLDKKIILDSIFVTPVDVGALLTENCHFQAGIGDLLLVKQTLKAYELAEFAHVENVLAGEARVREHRRLNLREEIQVEEEERETEKERNLQSTERNEMQSEAEKTVKSQFELESGLQVSGSYGPSVSFSAHLNVGFSTSSEETQRKAVSYSREVTEKTSERVRERVKRELRRRTLEQVEELNRHSITNEPATNGHVRGIYRWLNKVYDAQILNYGQRMMFEFVVPEPAAYLLYAMIENPPKDNELVKPEPPTLYGAALKPSHLTRTNYLDFVAKYAVRNVKEPPPEFQHVAVFDKQDKAEDASVFGRATKAEVPAGYRAFAATVMSDYTYPEDETPAFHVMVAGTNFDRTPYWGGEYKSLGSRYRELGIAYQLRNCSSFAVAVEVHCQLTPEGIAKWQQSVFDAIMEAYLVQRADYEEKLAALAIQQGVKVLGRNPLENRRIEREELRKLVLMMLTGNNNIARNSILPGVEPNIDLLKACVNGSWIRFFENAFEWHNMMYVFYPYFWGRKARWISALHFTDPDADFAAFLKAGAARVQVPVRPGFERAVAYFCQFGAVWEGNDPPLLDDDLYVPLVDEIAENLGKLDDGVPYPEGAGPWEVRIPTSLVLVQNLEEIPGIRDMLTGNNVTVIP